MYYLSLFSERIKWLREKKGLNQKEVAEKVGMSQQGYSNIENGNREPNLTVLSKLPGILGESLDFMLGVTDYDRELEELNSEVGDYVAAITMTYRKLSDSIEMFNTKELDPSEADIFKIRLNHLKSEIQRLQDAFPSIKERFIIKIESIPFVSDETRRMHESLKLASKPDDLLNVGLESKI